MQGNVLLLYPLDMFKPVYEKKHNLAVYCTEKGNVIVAMACVKFRTVFATPRFSAKVNERECLVANKLDASEIHLCSHC